MQNLNQVIINLNTSKKSKKEKKVSVKIIVTDNLKQELKEFSIKNRISLISLTAEICEDLFIELLKTEKEHKNQSKLPI